MVRRRGAGASLDWCGHAVAVAVRGGGDGGRADTRAVVEAGGGAGGRGAAVGGEGGDGGRGRALGGGAVVGGAAVLGGGRGGRGVGIGGLGLGGGHLLLVGLDAVGHLLGGLEVVVCGGVDIAFVLVFLRELLLLARGVSVMRSVSSLMCGLLCKRSHLGDPIISS
jgi:hypothetical protein